MAHLLFRLRHVTDEEALEVRQLLDEQGFDVYETQAGFFRLGVDAIWLRNTAQREAAEAALAAYQEKRSSKSTARARRSGCQWQCTNAMAALSCPPRASRTGNRRRGADRPINAAAVYWLSRLDL